MQSKPYRTLVNIVVELVVWSDDWKTVVKSLTPDQALKHADKVHGIEFRKLREGTQPLIGGKEEILETTHFGPGLPTIPSEDEEELDHTYCFGMCRI